uniref:ribonuclease H n=1 Tax=Trichuris muris TaxID=70415 RepID=A0A5S6QN38_TRIMR
MICRLGCIVCAKSRNCIIARCLLSVGLVFTKYGLLSMQSTSVRICSVVARHLRCPIMPNFYAVRRGRCVGIFNTWDECKSYVHQFSGAEFKKFKTMEDAQKFMNGCVKTQVATLPEAITSARVPVAATASSICTPMATVGIQPSALAATTCAQPSVSGIPKGIVPPAKLPVGPTSPGPSLEVKRVLTRTGIRKPVLLMKMNASGKKVGGTLPCSTLRSKGVKPKSASRYVAKRPRKQKVQIGADAVKEGFAVCYTDGACISNGRRKAKAGIGVYWGPDDPRNVSERLTGLQTNNRAEIEACSRAIEQAKLSGIQNLEIRTDSKYVIKCMTCWIHQWRRNNWTAASGLPVKNQVDLLRLIALAKSINVHWKHVPGHAGIAGNEAADKLAREGISK